MSEKFSAGDPAYVSPHSTVTGEVLLGQDASVWHNATLRGDIAPIEVGARTNIQDGAVLHVAADLPCIVGADVTVGHGAIVHGCKVGNRCLIGMGAILLNGVEIGEESIVGAGALLTEGKKIPPRSLVLGNPGKITRQVTDDEVRRIIESAATYCTLARKARMESSTALC